MNDALPLRHGVEFVLGTQVDVPLSLGVKEHEAHGVAVVEILLLDFAERRQLGLPVGGGFVLALEVGQELFVIVLPQQARALRGG